MTLAAERKTESKRHKIRSVLLLYYLLPLMVLLNASSVYFYFTAKGSLDEEMGERLKSIAGFAAAQVKDYHLAALGAKAAGGKTHDLLRGRLDEIRDANKMEKIYLFNAASESLLDTDPTIAPGTVYERHRFYADELALAAQGQVTTSILFQGRDGHFFKTAFAPVVRDGAAIAFVGVDGNAGFFESLKALSRALTYFGAACVLLVLASSFVVSRKIVTPVEELVRAAEKIGEGRLADPVRVTANNELGFLALSLDEMRRKLAERDTELQMMLQGVAHEVRNPLGGIELFAGILKEGGLDGKSVEHVERIQREVQNLKRLVQEFLEFARKPCPEMEPTALRPFFEEACFCFAAELGAKGARLVTDAPEGATALFDPHQMRRVVLNLVQNAIQAVAQGGEIYLKAEAKGDFLVISIRDNGPGIPAANLSTIFNPFFTTKEKGSGLGLAFARKIVAAHGGTIEVESDGETGTTFYVLLPA